MLRENSRETTRKHWLPNWQQKKDNAPGSAAAQKVSDLYNIAMDSVELNRERCGSVESGTGSHWRSQDGEICHISPKARRKASIAATMFGYADDMVLQVPWYLQTYQGRYRNDRFQRLCIWGRWRRIKISVTNIRNIAKDVWLTIMMMKLLLKAVKSGSNEHQNPSQLLVHKGDCVILVWIILNKMNANGVYWKRTSHDFRLEHLFHRSGLNLKSEHRSALLHEGSNR